MLASTGLAAPEAAWAQCIPTAPSLYLCTGPTTTPQSISAGNASVVAVAGFSVDSTASNATALAVSGVGTLSYRDPFGAPLVGGLNGLEMRTTGAVGDAGSILIDARGSITGRTNGIDAYNSTSGTTTIRVTAAVTGTAGYGIRSLSEPTTTGTVVEAGATQGGISGIYVLGGGGATSITATGDAVGTAFSGIYAETSATGTDLTVTATTARGDRRGIFAANAGTGATNVTATGDAVGTQFFGIYAANAATASNLTVNAASASGGQSGIFAWNAGRGATSVTSTGAAAGTSAYGILAVNGVVALDPGGTIRLTGTSTGTDVVVNAGSARGGDTGIVAFNAGTGNGSTSVVATGAVVGGGNGINAWNTQAGQTNLTVQAATVTAGGDGTGILAVNNGTGLTSVTATGPVQGGVLGIDARNSAAATQNLTVNAAAVQGGGTGVWAVNRGAAATVVTTTGDVEGTVFYGIAAANGAATSGGSGAITSIGGNNGINLAVTAVGARGGQTGILAVNTGTGRTSVTSAGNVTGTSTYGILAVNGGLTFNSDGTRNSFLSRGGTDLIVNAESASGGDTGIAALNTGSGSTSVTATGTVQGTSGHGIYAVNLFNTTIDLTVRAAAVRGPTGITALNLGRGTASVTTTGSVVGTVGDGIAVTNDAAGVNAIVNAVSVDGGRSGIAVRNSGTGTTSISATGLVTGLSGNGINATNTAAGTSLAVAAAAVTGGQDGIRAEHRGTGTLSVTATGLVQGGSHYGIHALSAAGAGLTVNAAAVTGGFAGIYAENLGAGATSVTATGLVQTAGNLGLFAQNAATGTGLSVAAAAVSSGDFGILAINRGAGATTVTATGAVVGASATGIGAGNFAGASDLTVRAATVGGGAQGILAENQGTGATTVVATGDVVGTTLYGVLAVNSTPTYYPDGKIRQISANNGTNLSVTSTNVMGGLTGILAVNTGTGSTVVTATGDVVGTSAYGVLAVNGRVDFDPAGVVAPILGNNGTDLAVSVAGARGGNSGIYAYNTGTGATSVTATGVVEGASAYGILAANASTATNLTVRATTVQGETIGLLANNRGRGTTSVTATGTVVSSIYGIVAENAALASDLTVSAATVVGGGIGIRAVNRGTGATSVTAGGAVSGATSYGIAAVNGTETYNADRSFAAIAGNNGTALTVDAVGSTGGVSGLLAINTGTGFTSVTVAGDAVGTSAYGIVAVNGRATFAATGLLTAVTGNNGTDLTVSAAAVTGGQIGIYAYNTGTGATSVTASGPVRGGVLGIGAVNDTTASSLAVRAAAVSGGPVGILATNNGRGTTSVIATDAVNGSNYAVLVETGATASSLAVAVAGASGGTTGIRAVNRGMGTTSVTATGSVAGTDSIGIDASNSATGTDLTVDAAAVSGGQAGIAVQNAGTGATLVTASGLVQGGAIYGIGAVNGAAASILTVRAAAVSGGTIGLLADNGGRGATSVTATGAVSGSDFGIVASNAATATTLTVTAAGVSSGGMAIYAVNRGSGFTSVAAAGDVVARGGDGLRVENAASANGLTLSASAVNAAATGISVLNNGKGTTLVEASSTVRGGTGAGIDVLASNLGSGVTVSAAAVSGGTVGIAALNRGVGDTRVTATGAVEGGDAALRASADNGRVALVVAATALLRNSSGSPLARMVVAMGNAVTVDNAGQMIGTAQLTGTNNRITNKGTWIAAGANDLGGATALLINDRGATLQAAVPGLVSTTSFAAGAFANGGMLTLQNGIAGDVARFNGNATITASASQAIDLGNGTADKVVVDGAATLSGTLVVSKTTGSYQLGGRYTVLTAAGGLTGRYSALAGDAGQLSTFFSVVDTYDANNAYLEVAQQRPFTTAAFTPNQWAAAGGAQSLPIGNPLFNAIATLQTDAQARVAFDQISGEAHASGRTALNEGSRMIRDAALSRLRNAFGGPSVSAAPATAQVAAYADDCGLEACQTSADPATPSRYAAWAQGLGSWGSTDGNGNAAGLFRTNAGFLVGADAQVFEVARLGLFGGYTRTTFNVADRQSSGGSDNAHLGLYGGAQVGPLGVRLGAAYSWHTLAATRGVAFPGFADTLRSDYAARTVQVFGELGYRIPLDKVTLEPFANLAYSNLTTDGFTEKGGAAALSVAGSSTNVTTTTLGLRTAYAFQLGETPSQVRGMLGWQHAFGDTTPLANMVLNGGSPFTVSGIPIARDSALIEAGFDVRLSERVSLGATYTGQFASGVQDQTVRASVTLNF